MVHASAASVARLGVRPPADLPRRLRRWPTRTLPALCALLAADTTVRASDAERRHFTSQQHLCLLLYHALSHSPSLRRTYARVSAQRPFVRLAGLARADPADERLKVNFSQLALSNSTRPATFLAGSWPPWSSSSAGPTTWSCPIHWS